MPRNGGPAVHLGALAFHLHCFRGWSLRAAHVSAVEMRERLPGSIGARTNTVRWGVDRVTGCGGAGFGTAFNTEITEVTKAAEEQRGLGTTIAYAQRSALAGETV